MMNVITITSPITEQTVTLTRDKAVAGLAHARKEIAYLERAIAATDSTISQVARATEIVSLTAKLAQFRATEQSLVDALGA